MKKDLLTYLFCLFSFVLQAQTGHLKFMGIPLDGKIRTFDKELRKKGFTFDHLAGKNFEGTYIYAGIFAGQRAQVFVRFDKKTKVVYGASAMMTRYTKESVIKCYEDMCDMLEEKYSKDEGVAYYEKVKKELKEAYGDEYESSFEWKQTKVENGYEETRFIIPNIQKGIRGDILVFVAEHISHVTYNTEYTLYVMYTDWQNDVSEDDSRLDDL